MVVDHIFTHSAYAYLTSPFDNCMSICIDTQDGFGQPMPFIGYKIVIKVLDRGEEINSLHQ